MRQQARSECSLLPRSLGNAIQFIVENGAPRDGSEMDASLHPGLSTLLTLQKKQQVLRETARNSSAVDDPLSLEDYMSICTREQLCAHTQGACALARNAVARSLHNRSEARIRRYGEAVMHLAEASSSISNGDVHTLATCAANSYPTTAFTSSLYPSPASVSDPLQSPVTKNRPVEAKSGIALGSADAHMVTEVEEEEEEEEEDLEMLASRHPNLGVDQASAWVQRRYLRCCSVMHVPPSSTVSQRLSQCVGNPFGGSSITNSSSSAENKSLVSQVPDTSTPHPCASAGQACMSPPKTTLLMREMKGVSYELNIDLSCCPEVGQDRHHFIVLLGVLEGCRSSVVTLNFSKASLHDDEVRVLCLFCCAYLRRLRAMDLSGNRLTTDRVAGPLKHLVASMPLLRRLDLRATSLSRTTKRTVKSIIRRRTR